jgi:hypothetical protein
MIDSNHGCDFISISSSICFASRRNARSANGDLRDENSEANHLPQYRTESRAGALVEDLEREIAPLLGKEVAVFCTSGKAAQLSVLRVRADRRGRTDRLAPSQRSGSADRHLCDAK